MVCSGNVSTFSNRLLWYERRANRISSRSSVFIFLSRTLLNFFLQTGYNIDMQQMFGNIEQEKTIFIRFD